MLRMRQIIGNGALSRSVDRRDCRIPIGEERADRQTRRMMGHDKRRSASRAVAALALLLGRGYLDAGSGDPPLFFYCQAP